MQDELEQPLVESLHRNRLALRNLVQNIGMLTRRDADRIVEVLKASEIPTDADERLALATELLNT